MGNESARASPPGAPRTASTAGRSSQSAARGGALVGLDNPAPQPADPGRPISPAMRRPSKARSRAPARDHRRCQRGVRSHRRAVSPGGTGPLQLRSKEVQAQSGIPGPVCTPAPGSMASRGEGGDEAGVPMDPAMLARALDLNPPSNGYSSDSIDSIDSSSWGAGASSKAAGERVAVTPESPTQGRSNWGQMPSRTWATRKGNPTTSRTSRLSRKYHRIRVRSRPRVARPGPSGRSRSKAAAASRCSQTSCGAPWICQVRTRAARPTRPQGQRQSRATPRVRISTRKRSSRVQRASQLCGRLSTPDRASRSHPGGRWRRARMEPRSRPQPETGIPAGSPTRRLSANSWSWPRRTSTPGASPSSRRVMRRGSPSTRA